MFPFERQGVGDIGARPNSQNEETVAEEEEDALVLRMEAMMAESDHQEERLSFADSERFDEDDEEQFSAQASESSSLSHHWRGWAKKGIAEMHNLMPNPTFLTGPNQSEGSGKGGLITSSLKDLAARKVASALSFDFVESTYARLPNAQKRLNRELAGDNHLQDSLPEQLVLLILKHCFPESPENIRLYSCLTNCGDRLFSLGEQLFQNGAVSELFQIGYHLSAVVQEQYVQNDAGKGRTFDVSIRVDRCQIVACSCSCSNSSIWCQHAVAACLQRILSPETVQYRPAIWDSITALRDKELKKLAQYLINELPKEYIPVAQKLIDALKDPRSEINGTHGAPDPTAGPTDDTPAVWYMDERTLHEEVRKTLVNFMRPSAMVCEVQSLLTSPPALAYEWSVLYRTFSARQPESMWNLLGMVRVMLSRGDANGPTLLHVLTEQCLALDSVILRWYQISLAASGLWQPIGACNRSNAQQCQSRQLNVYLLCQELAVLWSLVALNPRLNFAERERLWALLQLYQRTAVTRIWAILGKMAETENNIFGTVMNNQGQRLSRQNASFSQHHFPAFFPALQACHQLDWTSREVQRLMRSMEGSSRLNTDIQIARRQSDRFPNLPFLRDSPNGLFLLDLVEMEHQLRNSETYNPDAVILPPKSKRKKKRRKGQQRKEKSEPKVRKGVGQRLVEKVRRKDSNDLEQLSEVSSEEESSRDAQGFSGLQQRRKSFDEALDLVFAEAHAESDDPFSLRFTSCEALFSHGYFRESLQLAEQLSLELLAKQSNLLSTSTTELDDENVDKSDSISEEIEGCSKMAGKVQKPLLSYTGRYQKFNPQLKTDLLRRIESQNGSSARGRLWRSHPRLMSSSQLTQRNLFYCTFLAKLLLLGEEFETRKRNRSQSNEEQIIHGQKATRFRLRTLELCLATLCNLRGPAATKFLEMEINHLEGELFTLLHRLELCPLGLRLIRSLAKQHLDEYMDRSLNIVTVPPTRMAHYVLNALSYSLHIRHVQSNSKTQSAASELLPPCQHETLAERMSTDDELALNLALQVLSQDIHLSEADHPLLCECIRRHRRDLQMTLLTRNRDTPEKLARVLSTVLDPKVHRMYEDHCSSNVEFFLPNTSSATTLQSSTLSYKQTQPQNRIQSSYSSADSSPSNSPFQISRNIDSTGVDNSRRTSIDEQENDKFSLFPGQTNYMVLANQASEAQAHHMFEFAKSLLQEAGGNQSTAMFNPMLMEGGLGIGVGIGPGIAVAAGPHRNLHICSLLIALYALGLNNECSPSWNTRTYSTHVSWIQAQALDIGRQALEIIRRTWRKHLTPTEVAALADKASQSADRSVVEEAAQLALSVLPEANSLLPTESQKALFQCKERSPKMLEEACLAVEKAAERGGVYPEVLFRVAHHWYDDLYLTYMLELGNNTASSTSQMAQQPHQLVHWAYANQHNVNKHPFGFVYPPHQPQSHPYSLGQLTPKQQQQQHFGAIGGQMPMAAVVTTAAHFYSPSVPPPPLPTATANSTHRLQSSYSAPNMAASSHHLAQQPFTVSLPLPPLIPTSYGRMPSIGGVQHCPKFLQSAPQPLASAFQQISPPNPHRMQPTRIEHHYHRSIARPMDERALQLLKNAHRVGIAAMNNLRNNESIFSKFAKHPPSCDEICWLLDVTLEIGDPEYIRLFTEKAIICVYSPFVLLELLRAVLKFFRHQSNQHRIQGTGQIDSILLSASSDLAKICLQQAKATMASYSLAGPVIELALHAIAAVFNAACHKLNFNSFNATDQEYVCELALATRDIFRLIPPYHDQQGGKRRYMDLFMEHMQKQKIFKKCKTVQTAVQNALQQQQQ